MSTKTPRAKLLAALNQHALTSAAFDACHDLHGYPVADACYPPLLEAKRQLDQFGALNKEGDIEVRLTKKQHDRIETTYLAEYDRCQAQQPGPFSHERPHF